MKIRWKLRMAAAQREVRTGIQLRRLLAESVMFYLADHVEEGRLP